jgi:predicted AlkP superfamily phosphohydrolase/phosphomutase
MKQYLTKEEIEKASIEELENNVKAIKEELDQLKESIETEESKERFKELVHLKILSNIQINLIEFREMVHRGRKNNK